MSQLDAIHLDARPGGTSPFSPADEVEDYAAWLLTKAKACETKEGKYTLCHGVGQKLQQAISAARAGAKIRASGRYAGALAAVIETAVRSGISDEVLKQIGGKFEVEVLG